MKNFTKITLALVLSLGLFTNAQAQEEGESVVSLGVGFVTFYTGETSLPPISIAYDYGFSDEISIGGYLGYASASEEFGNAFIGNYEWTYTYIIAGVRGLYHYDLIDGIDTYGGAMLGYNVSSVSFEGDPALEALVSEPSVGGFTYNVFVGGRYFFNDNFAAFAELGYGIAAINLGLSYKL